MRTLIIATALLTAFAAQAEPKRSAKEPIKPSSAKEAPAVVVAEFQPKEIALAAPEVELKTKDLSESALDRKLASRKSKALATDATVMREPVQLKLDEPTAAEPAARAAATTANKP